MIFQDYRKLNAINGEEHLPTPSLPDIINKILDANAK